jgi:hypothetical protein
MKNIIILILALGTFSLQASTYDITIENKPFFSEANCNENVHIEQFKEFFNVCNTFKITLTESTKYNITYKLISKPKIKNDWISLVEVANIDIDGNLLVKEEVFELDTEYYDYGILGCTLANDCEIIELNDKVCAVEPCTIKTTIEFNKENLPSNCN